MPVHQCLGPCGFLPARVPPADMFEEPAGGIGNGCAHGCARLCSHCLFVLLCLVSRGLPKGGGEQQQLKGCVLLVLGQDNLPVGFLPSPAARGTDHPRVGVLCCV
jgi:hypothetical protein